jgi:Domain of unknown function (DUF5134)
MPPSWLLDIFAAVMLLVSALSAARLGARVVARHLVSDGADVDIAHLLMGIAMAGMLAAGASTLPNGAWEVIFAALTVWFAWRVTRDLRASGPRALAGGHCAPHLIHSAAMMYMFAAMTTGGAAGMSSMGAMGGAGAQALKYPTLALVFGLLLAGYSVWDLDQLSGRRYSLAIAPAGPGPDGMGGAVTVAAAVATPAAVAPARELVLSAAVTVACRVAMGVTMALMLFILI